jgi:hypothetical protein
VERHPRAAEPGRQAAGQRPDPIRHDQIDILRRPAEQQAAHDATDEMHRPSRSGGQHHRQFRPVISPAT